MVIDFYIAEARTIQRLLGKHGPLWIAEQLAILAQEADSDRIGRFGRVVACYRTLTASLNP